MTTAVQKKKGKRIVKGIEHGLSGYTNRGCKCAVCTQANTEHAREYRQRRFAGSPLCAVPKCRRVQSRAYGNSLCYRHAQVANQFKDRLERMSRTQLKRYIKQEDLEVNVYRSMEDDDLRQAIFIAVVEGNPEMLIEYN